jgi:hypothetical protein
MPGGMTSLLTPWLPESGRQRSFRRVLRGSGFTDCPVRVDVQALKDFPVHTLKAQTTAIGRLDLLFHETVALPGARLDLWL